MNEAPSLKHSPHAAALLAAALVLMGCNSQNTRSDTQCAMPESRSLETATQDVRRALEGGCEERFDDYWQRLLAIAEGDPRPQNKQHFSELLVWASERGLVSRRQAQSLYNRYFNVKFVSLMGEYSNCAYTCPTKDKVMSRMEQELADKEQGLLRVSADREGYSRADRLYQETELVLEATCRACDTAR